MGLFFWRKIIMRTYKLSIALSFLVLMSFNLNALANSNTFNIYNKNGERVGDGIFEKLPFSKAKVSTNYNHYSFEGESELNRGDKKFVKGMQSNRGVLPNKQQKTVVLTLVADDNSQLNCEINSNYGKVFGHCIDSSNNKLILNNTSYSSF